MPILYVLIGPPGAGKSTWRERHMRLNSQSIVVSLDDLVDRYADEHGLTYSEAFQRAPLKEFEREVKASFQTAVREGRDIVVDRTNMSRKARSWFLRESKGYLTKAVMFEIDPIVLFDRLDKRAKATGKSIPRTVVESMMRRLDRPEYREFDVIETIYADPPTKMQRFQHGVRESLTRIFGA